MSSYNIWRPSQYRRRHRPVYSKSNVTTANYAGVLATSGLLVRQVNRSLIGSLSTSGSVVKSINKAAYVGTLNSSGVLVKQPNKTFTGGDYQSLVKGESPLGYWRFGNSVGSFAADSSLNANHATLYNSPTLGAAGAIANDSDTAITFASASTQYGDRALNLSSTNKLTIEFWLKWTTYGTDGRTALSHGDAGALLDGAIIVQPNSATGNFSISVSGVAGGATSDSITFTRPSAGAYHHYVIVIDRSLSGNARLLVYVDGILQTAITQTNATSTANLLNAILVFMAVYVGANHFVYGNGTLDEIAIYPVALSQATVTRHYQTGLALNGYFAGSLVKQTNKSFAGALTTAGGIVKSISRTITGNLTSTGNLIKQIYVSFAGTLTSSGSLTTQIVTMRTFSGTLTTAGNLLKQINKSFTSTLTFTGNIVKAISKTITGGLSPSGVLVKRISTAFVGVFGSSGTLTEIIERTLSGNLNASGSLVKSISTSFSGTLPTSGNLIKHISTAFTGVFNSSGELGTAIGVITRTFAGTLSTSGNLVKQVNKTFVSNLTNSGNLIKHISTSLVGTLTSNGNLTGSKTYIRTFSANLATGGLVKFNISKTFSGILTTIGTLIRELIGGVPPPDVCEPLDLVIASQAVTSIDLVQEITSMTIIAQANTSLVTTVENSTLSVDNNPSELELVCDTNG